MTIRYLSHTYLRNKAEHVMPGAPEVQLKNGKHVVPQHYLRFEQSLESLRALLFDIKCESEVLLFAGEKKGLLYLQAGIIGHENYTPSQSKNDQAKLPISSTHPPKIVYGRKWFIGSDTPTSEVIQTAYLAIKKLKEHEVREFFTILETESNRVSAPFSSHQDLPLMVDNQDLINTGIDQRTVGLENIEDLLNRVRFRGQRFVLQDMFQSRSGRIMLEIKLEQGESFNNRTLSEFEYFECGLVLQSFNPVHFLHGLMDALILHSDSVTAERFTYCGFKRFSRDVDPVSIAKISIKTRDRAPLKELEEFSSVFKGINFLTDAGRVPDLGVGGLALKNRNTIERVSALSGHMPTGFTEPELSLSNNFKMLRT